MKIFAVGLSLAALLAGCASAPAPAPAPSSSGASSTPLSSGVDRTIEMAVGETKRVADQRNDSCGGEAPSFEAVALDLPQSPLIAYSDGGVDSRMSRTCGVVTTVRVVNATGLQRGTGVFEYYNGVARIVVR